MHCFCAAALPPPYEELDEANGIRRITEYKFNEDGKKIKVTIDCCWYVISAYKLLQIITWNCTFVV